MRLLRTTALKLQIFTIFVAISLVIPTYAQSNGDIDALLHAYNRARVDFLCSQPTSLLPQEVVCGANPTEALDQWGFYSTKLTKLLDRYAKDAFENPRVYCLPALEIYSKVYDIEIKLFNLYYNVVPWQSLSYIQQHCSAHGIHYDKYEKRM
jgi:hypothetical protein